MTKAVPLQTQVLSLHFAKVDIEISLDGSWVVKPPAAGSGRGRAELQKGGVAEGCPLIASGSRSLGFAGGSSWPQVLRGTFQVSPEQQQVSCSASRCLFVLLRMSGFIACCC